MCLSHFRQIFSGSFCSVCVGCTVRIEWGVAAISYWNHSIHHLFHITIAKKIASWENDPTHAIRHHRFKFNKILCVLLNYHTKIEHRFAYINRAARLYNQIIFLYIQHSHTHQNHHQQQQQQWPKAARVTQQKKKKTKKVMEKWGTIRNKQQSHLWVWSLCVCTVYAFVVLSPPRKKLRTCSITFRSWSFLTLFFNCRELCRLYFMFLAFLGFLRF